MLRGWHKPRAERRKKKIERTDHLSLIPVALLKKIIFKINFFFEQNLKLINLIVNRNEVLW